MRIDVYLLLVAPVVLAALGPALAGRLAPPAAARTLAVLSVIGAGSLVWALAVLAVGGLGRTSGVQGVLHSNPVALALSDPVPRKVGVLAALLLAGVLLRAVVLLLGRRRGLRALAAAGAALPAAGDLLVVQDDRPDAYAVPGAARRPGRIVVTSGMLGLLSAAERRVLLAHERAHLEHRHHRYLTVGQSAAWVCPPLERVLDRIAFSLERWADEEAAEAVGDRGLAARALARAALAAGGPAAGAGAPRGALGYVWLGIADRARALQSGRPASRLAALVPVALASAFTVALFADTSCALLRCLTALG